MSSSPICSKFAQNAWRKDLCSNCFKSKEEHKLTNSKAAQQQHTKKTEFSIATKSNAATKTPKSIMKFGLLNSKLSSAKKSTKVSFPKDIAKVIGYGGEWSDGDGSEDDDFTSNGHNDDSHLTDEEDNLELKRLTKTNTDFNTNNGNLLGDAEENIKKSFAALRLGAPQVDSDGKKQTLKINVTPFGTPSKLSCMKAKFELNKEESRLNAVLNSSKIEKKEKQKQDTHKKVNHVVSVKEEVKKTVGSVQVDSDGKNSPPIERAMEKSLLEEISETLEQNQKQQQEQTTPATKIQSGKDGKIKFEITSLTESITPSTKTIELKKPIARNQPIAKDQTKPKINIFPKYTDSSDSNSTSDNENGVSAYYDVVETNGYENLPDGKSKDEADNIPTSNGKPFEENKSVFSSSQYITDMLLSSRTKAASYSLHEGSFMTSKITSDGLIVTKCASDDALDSTGSSFDGSSDEETSYNMNRSESDSGIGICITNEYNSNEKCEKKLSISTNNSDYEDIQVVEETTPTVVGHQPKIIDKSFSLEKSRELAGEPDGSADPDGTNNTVENLPALPKSPPPNSTPSKVKSEGRTSFLHGMQKNIAAINSNKKPDVPAKPTAVNVLKTFAKRQPSQAEQQLVSQLQQVIKGPTAKSFDSDDKNSLSKKDGNDYSKMLKKGRAPNPPPTNNSKESLTAPPTPEKDYGNEPPKIHSEIKKIFSVFDDNSTITNSTKNESVSTKHFSPPSPSSVTLTKLKTISSQSDDLHPSIYTRNPSLQTANNFKSTSPVIREKDKRERATVNPKFRSLNTFSHRKSQQQLITAASALKAPSTPEPTPRKNLSLSEECLADVDKKQQKKTKFSIKKFLRMGTSKTTDNLHKKDGIYSEICTGDDGSIAGKPRLVIIHPIDINTTAVEVVKDIPKKSPDGVDISPLTPIVSGKPPAPPQRTMNIDGNRTYEINKPARPPPPKSAELRRKQKIGFNITTQGGSVKSKSDNVYANLGEIRSAIAPRKPERTASMREREAQLELARKRNGNENFDTISVCSSNGGSVSNDHQISPILATNQSDQKQSSNILLSKTQPFTPSNTSTPSAIKEISSQQMPTIITAIVNTNSTANTIKPIITDLSPKDEKLSTFEHKKKIDISTAMPTTHTATDLDDTGSNVGGGNKTIASKLELFEKGLSENTKVKLSDGLKDSVRKISSTIDSYLKDKRDYESMYDMAKTIPPPTPTRNCNTSISSNLININNSSSNMAVNDMVVDLRRNYELINAVGRNQGRSSFQDNHSISGQSYTTRSEYGGAGGNRTYSGFNNSLANIPRVISASYCGSEMGESDIYSPYSFYGGSEAGTDVANDIHDSVWGVASPTKSRVKTTNRLWMRKGRSVVHKNIEDNYSAVVVANHEALAQVLEQLQQTPTIPMPLRSLANAINLRFDDFTVLEGGQAFVVGKRAFHAAIWNASPVTLALSADCNQISGVSGELNQLSGGVSGVLNPISEFCDLVPNYYLPLMPSTEARMMLATISVLPRMQLDTFQSIGSILKNKSQILDKHINSFRGSIPNLSGQQNDKISSLRNVCSVQNLTTLNEENADKTSDDVLNIPGMPSFDDVMCREVGFIMLQLVNGLKNLQAKAIEEMPLSLSNVILCKEIENNEAQARLCVLHGLNPDEDEQLGTLCKCAHIALTDMLPKTKMSTILSKILLQERSETLSKAKAFLEFFLWGPSDVDLTGSIKERESALQRWLDLERATVLHGLVRTRIKLTIYEECHLMFLVRSNVKIMNVTAKLVSSLKTNEE